MKIVNKNFIDGSFKNLTNYNCNIIYNQIFRYYLTPIFKRFIARKVEQQFRDRYHNSSYEKRHKAGETVIDKMPNKKKSSDNVGSIDYEEMNKLIIMSFSFKTYMKHF